MEWDGRGQQRGHRDRRGRSRLSPDSVNYEYFTDSQTMTMCSWKGDELYDTLEVDGARDEDAAWYSPTSKDAEAKIKGHISFWPGVEVTE